MGPNPGLRDSLNAIREQTIKDNKVYHQYVPIVTDTTSIGEFATPILEHRDVQNEFLSQLIKRIVYTSIEVKRFNNPLSFLEKETMPLGATGQEIYVNPAKGRQFNVNDFAGLLAKYEADVKVQYTQVNMDIQYPVSITREKLRSAFVSWESLNSFVDALSASLSNGAYIDRYRFTKLMVSNAFRENRVAYRLFEFPPNGKSNSEAFLAEVRALYLNFQSPSTAFNAWNKVGGYGNAITTWSNRDDIVLLIRNDYLANIDVYALAAAFNIDYAKMMGRVVGVDSFDVYNDDGTLIYDGSGIIGIMADRSWFNIRMQDFAFDEFYNANNRSWNTYLNQVMMYNYSLFSNAVVFATTEPEVNPTAISFENGDLTINVDDVAGVPLTVTPVNAVGLIEYVSNSPQIATVEPDPTNPRVARITGVGEGETTITATMGDESANLNVTVNAPRLAKAVKATDTTAKTTDTTAKTADSTK